MSIRHLRGYQFPGSGHSFLFFSAPFLHICSIWSFPDSLRPLSSTVFFRPTWFSRALSLRSQAHLHINQGRDIFVSFCLTSYPPRAKHRCNGASSHTGCSQPSFSDSRIFLPPHPQCSDTCWLVSWSALACPANCAYELSNPGQRNHQLRSIGKLTWAFKTVYKEKKKNWQSYIYIQPI